MAAPLPELDAIRAMSNACIVASHIVWFLGTPPMTLKFREDHIEHIVPRVAFNTLFPAMEAFLILTGLLAVYQLVPEMQASRAQPHVTAMQYIRRRILRIVPAYYFTLVLTCLLITGQHSNTALPEDMRNLLTHVFKDVRTEGELCVPRRLGLSLGFLNSLGGCNLHFWNLSVQMQFYVLLPVLLLALSPQSPGFVRRVVMAAAALLAASLAYRHHAVWEHDLHLPFVPFKTKGEDGVFRMSPHTINFITSIYITTVARLSPLALGMLVGCLMLSPKALEAVRKQWVLVTAGAAVCLAAVVALLVGAVVDVEFKEEEAQGPAEAAFAYVWFMGLIIPSLVAYLIAFMISKAGPVARGVSYVLRMRFWQIPAQLSYSCYLIHILVLLGAWWLIRTPMQLYYASIAEAKASPVYTALAQLGLRVPDQHLVAVHRAIVLAVLWVGVQAVSMAAAFVIDEAVSAMLRALGVGQGKGTAAKMQKAE